MTGGGVQLRPGATVIDEDGRRPGIRDRVDHHDVTYPEETPSHSRC